MTRIKICGITNKIDAIDASRLGVDMLGFVFYKKSKRYVESKTARDIINELPTAIDRVGIFVNENKEAVLEIAQDSSLNLLQFHGIETPSYCADFKDSGYKVIKAFRIRRRRDLEVVNDYDVDYFLLDAYSRASMGGTGKAFDWKLLKDYEFLRPFFLSGGLGPGNVSRAIKEVSPYGVDVSTGVERTPGKKDLDLMKRFVENVRRAG